MRLNGAILKLPDSFSMEWEDLLSDIPDLEIVLPTGFSSVLSKPEQLLIRRGKAELFVIRTSIGPYSSELPQPNTGAQPILVVQYKDVPFLGNHRNACETLINEIVEIAVSHGAEVWKRVPQ